MSPDRENAGLLADLRTAASFLTILPIDPGKDGYRPGGLAEAAWCFPLIGLLPGALGGLVFAAAIWVGLDGWLAAVLCIATLVLVTGGLHEDGLGDFADGMGGASRERRLTIMHDSQAGNFAIVALCLLFAGRIGAVADIAQPEDVGVALLVAASLSRAAMVVVMHLMPSARAEGLSAGAGRPDIKPMWAAVAICALIALFSLGISGALICFIGAALPTAILAWLAHKRLGGQTGDVLGAVQLTSEFGCLAAIAIVVA